MSPEVHQEVEEYWQALRDNVPNVTGVPEVNGDVSPFDHSHKTSAYIY